MTTRQRKQFATCLVAMVVMVALATPLVALANPTDADPFGVGRSRSCEEKIKNSLSDAVDSLNELDLRIRAVPSEKAAFFAREEPHIFETHDPQRMGALFGDPYYALWTLHSRVRELVNEVQHFGEAQRRPLSAAEALWYTSGLLTRFASAAGALTLAATGRAREGGPNTPFVLTDEQISTYQQNLEGIAMYVSEYGRCSAMLEALQRSDVVKK
ncbi:hypothetical protein LGM65_31245 [Burkholderia anthina]|uniref:hypothetical protein n=1 Tax=Burkholderia anthina TaxID=179879 RepID=UPI001CF5BD9D|nr:hypothetical protein [Burkholderia anthina]MCA8095298.1 hypothetical protein [Burkholderia anthina]